MAPILQDCWRFTAVDNRMLGFQGTPERPWINTADQPSGLTFRQWEDIKLTVAAWITVEYNLFQMAMLFATMVPAFTLFFVDVRFFQSGGLGILVLFGGMIGHFFLTDALFGVWRCRRVRKAIYQIQPKFRQEGLELEFSTEGEWFYVVGILTITRSQYEPKTAEDLAAERGEAEIC